MKKGYWILITVIALALLLVGIFIGATYAQGPGGQGAMSTQATPLGTAFTYQGQLSNAAGPVTDNCRMAFRLYDDVDGGVQVGQTISTTVPITDGLFTVMLNDTGQFGPSAFTGDARWLGIKVKCTDDATYIDLGCQALAAAPYALHAVSTGALQGHPVTTTAPTTGQGLSWDGAAWAPSAAMVTGVLSGDIVMAYPFEFDISALGDVPPSSVTVVASGFKATQIPDPESPLMIDWKVTGTPALTLTLRVWDADGVEYKDTAPIPAAWVNRKLYLSFLATGQ
jgi:hypothetical protein